MIDLNKWTEIDYNSPAFLDKLKANHYEVETKELIAHWSIDEDDFEYLTGEITEYGYDTFIVDKTVLKNTHEILENSPFYLHVTRVCYILKKCYYERLRFEMGKELIIPDLKSLYNFLAETTNKITFQTFNKAKNAELVNPHIIKMIKLFLIDNILSDNDAQHLLAYKSLNQRRAKGSHFDKTENYYYYKAMTMISLFLKSTDEYKAGGISQNKCYKIIYDILLANSFLPKKELEKDVVLDTEKSSRIREGIRDNAKNFKFLQNTFLPKEKDISNIDDEKSEESLEDEIEQETKEEMELQSMMEDDDHYNTYMERRLEISEKIKNLRIKLQS